MLQGSSARESYGAAGEGASAQRAHAYEFVMLWSMDDEMMRGQGGSGGQPAELRPRAAGVPHVGPSASLRAGSLRDVGSPRLRRAAASLALTDTGEWERWRVLRCRPAGARPSVAVMERGGGACVRGRREARLGDCVCTCVSVCVLCCVCVCDGVR